MEENFKVGNFICELRKEKGLSQAELGAKLHVTNKAVSRWETGRGFPDSALLLPLAEILGVTADEILRGECVTTTVSLQELPVEATPSIAQVNTAFAYRAAKKLLIRDSLIVIPTVVFSVLWLILKLAFHIDLAPGGNYYQSMMANLIFPLVIIGIGQLIYALCLVTDTIRFQKKAVFLKILTVIAVWYAVTYLLVIVYIRRVILYFKSISAYKRCNHQMHS